MATEGVRGFTTARVAEKAGFGVGSLYQYFPNKATILFRLQSDEWQQTITLMRSILEDVRHPPLQRLRELVRAFIRSECDEAAMRTALHDTAPLYRDEPEAQETRHARDRLFLGFMREALPDASQETLGLAGGLISTTLGAVGKHFSERPRSKEEIEIYAQALADMFCAYIESLQKGGGKAGQGLEENL